MSSTGPYTFFDVIRGALRKVFDPLEGVRVGLMINHDNNNNCEGFGRTKCSNGGYIMMGFDRFEKGDLNGAKARFHNYVDSLPTPQGGVSHSYQGKELFFEFFRYLTGQGVYNAHKRLDGLRNQEPIQPGCGLSGDLMGPGDRNGRESKTEL